MRTQKRKGLLMGFHSPYKIRTPSMGTLKTYIFPGDFQFSAEIYNGRNTAQTFHLIILRIHNYAKMFSSPDFWPSLRNTLLLFCLIRAIRGPRIADRVISINMMGTLIVITICVLAFLMNEGYLVDIAMIYTMLSFLAVVLLTKIYMGVYREKRRRREAAENQAKEDEAHE